ncbi:MAG: trehalose-phosphatase [Candidatus Thermoplasmatota archaeon]|nr:trehalose-phosphatase [Candidatus Thermoplasmatota archaeon]
MRADALILFLDYDGTLVPFKDRPTEVRTPEKIIIILRQLIKNPKIRVVIVTGRSLYDIKKLLKMKGLFFIALHGLQTETSDGMQYSWKQAEQARFLIQRIKKTMQEELSQETGAFLEDKNLTVVLHYRLLHPERIPDLQQRFKNIVQSNDKKKILEIIKGAKVLEVRPKGWNKGKAIELFLAKQQNKKNILPLYIGDDITDEDAFQMLGKRGISIYVKNESTRKTAAQYWVKNPDDVFSFLKSLARL